MSKTIGLREANQAFARCIRAVEAGEVYVITRNGRPVARLLPVRHERMLTPEQEAAMARTRARMEKGWPINTGPLDRDALYDDHRPPMTLTGVANQRFTLDTNLSLTFRG